MDTIFGVLSQVLVGWPRDLTLALSALVPALAALTVMALGPLIYVYAERKIAGFTQDRLGPMRVGPYGLLQTIADTTKLLFKEAVFPRAVNRFLFVLGPCLVNLAAFMPLVTIPFGSRAIGADLNVGLYYVAAVSSVATVGLLMAGWASHNKYSLFGGMRSAAQIVSYEIPSVVTLLSVVILTGSLSMQDIVRAQMGGLSNWYVFRFFPVMPVAFLVFFVSGMAECNRTPFDIPEAESELVGGFHTEYSGFFFALFFMAEYTEMLVISAVTSVLFLGGWTSPFPGGVLQSVPGLPGVGLGPVWLIGKAWLLMFVMMWLRWTLPRLRVDQLMYVAWKVLLPIALALTAVVGGLVLWGPNHGFPWDRFVAWISVAVLLFFLLGIMVRAVRWSRHRARELAA